MEDEPKYPPRGSFAFPWVSPDHMCAGMTLREWYAGQCIAAIARSDVNSAIVRKGTAEWAFAMADAMIEAGKA